MDRSHGRFRLSPSRTSNNGGYMSPATQTGKSRALGLGVKLPSMGISPGLSPSLPSGNGSSPVPRRFSTPSPRMHSPSPSDDGFPNENVKVTVRFRPLSLREIQRGDDVGWYADSDKIVRSESNPNVAYAFDKVFGPATTTRAVYDVAAQPIVNDAMDGMNGTVFAYGVTSAGKTHTMHGDQKSPGVIPLAVKEVFSIIQETPGREFLLRVSYLEIYNEVINDLLNPASQNLRIREDSQLGTYVENIKEEVVLSAAHALSLIAAGEEHRHVGSTNFNTMSSRSHTIFRMTVESTGTDKQGFEEVALSQLNLIDLAGSESSKAATSGVRRKEGSYINKSLLTLGTVISKLSEGKQASHIPYRDSKLTRLLQSALSGNGRISLICTVTPASGTMEETHNTLKFAHRAKHVEVRAEHNRIVDDKSLIKRYQKEISELKQELLRVKTGMLTGSVNGSPQEDLVLLREKLEADQQLMQCRLEEEEQAKAALMGRIQRLTKLILVSTKSNVEPPPKHGHRRRLSFGEEDLAYLKLRKMELMEDDEEDLDDDLASDDASPLDGGDDKKLKRRSSMLSWLKLKRIGSTSASSNGDASVGSSPVRSLWPSSPSRSRDVGEMPRRPASPGRLRTDSLMRSESVVEPVLQPTQAGELFSVSTRARRPASEDAAEQVELIKEQLKILSGELALCSSNFKRLTEQKGFPSDEQEQEKQRLKEEMKEKKRHIKMLEQKIQDTTQLHPAHGTVEEMAKTIAKLKALLSEKTFDMEIINTDNRILQDSLRSKTDQHNKLLEEMNMLRVELTRVHHLLPHGSLPAMSNGVGHDEAGSILEQSDELVTNNGAHDTAGKRNTHGDAAASLALSGREASGASLSQVAEKTKLQMQLKLALEERDMLAKQQKQLAKDLAEARAVAVLRPGPDGDQLQAFGYKNGMDAVADVPRLKEQLQAAQAREAELKSSLAHKEALELELETAKRQLASMQASGSREGGFEALESQGLQAREKALEEALTSKAQLVGELQRELQEAKQREDGLENDLATMWVLVAELRRQSATSREIINSLPPRSTNSPTTPGGVTGRTREEVKARLEAVEQQLFHEQRRTSLLESQLARLKGDYAEELSLSSMEELASLHQEALAKLSFLKVKAQEKLQPDTTGGKTLQEGVCAHLEEFNASSLCRGCFDETISTRLLPCKHICLCQTCATTATSCPTCLGPVTAWEDSPTPGTSD